MTIGEFVTLVFIIGYTILVFMIGVNYQDSKLKKKQLYMKNNFGNNSEITLRRNLIDWEKESTWGLD